MKGAINSQSKNRMIFPDTLRMAMIFLVVLVHAGFVYDFALDPIWIVSDPMKDPVFFKIFMILDIFIIPVLFLISGYFFPQIESVRAMFETLVRKFKRLMLPWLFGVLFLIPLYKVIFLFSRGLPRESIFNYFHFFGNMMMNQGWLWFLPVLFVFNILALPLSKIPFAKGRFSPVFAVGATLILGVLYGFFFYFFNGRGWSKSIFLDFQNERIGIYFIIYILGLIWGRFRFWEKASFRKIPLLISGLTVVISGVIYYRFQWNYNFYQGTLFLLSRGADAFVVSVSYILSLLGFLFILTEIFRKFLNRENIIIRQLNSNSYSVYILHFIITGIIALPLMKMELPASVKLILLTLATFLLSNGIASAFRECLRLLFRKKIQNPENKK